MRETSAPRAGGEWHHSTVRNLLARGQAQKSIFPTFRAKDNLDMSGGQMMGSGLCLWHRSWLRALS